MTISREKAKNFITSTALVGGVCLVGGLATYGVVFDVFGNQSEEQARKAAALAKFNAAPIELKFQSAQWGNVALSCTDPVTGVTRVVAPERTVEGFKNQLANPACIPQIKG